MRLADLVATEAGTTIDQVMLLRHSNSTIHALQAKGGTVEEYTFMQPTDSPYDYLDPAKPATAVVVVIVNDAVYGVYRVIGVDAEGTTYSLASDAHRRFDVERGKPERPAKRFVMEQVRSVSVGLQIRGWERRSRTPVQRADGGFFNNVTIDVPSEPVSADALLQDFAQKVQRSIASGSIERRKRLALAPKLPRMVTTTSFAFVRNADVVVEVLLRAGSTCELCRSSAPFNRRSDGSPYLEVHHRVRLADGGEDTVENAIAVCPNCHRYEHYG